MSIYLNWITSYPISFRVIYYYLGKIYSITCINIRPSTADATLQRTTILWKVGKFAGLPLTLSGLVTGINHIISNAGSMHSEISAFLKSMVCIFNNAKWSQPLVKTCCILYLVVHGLSLFDGTVSFSRNIKLKIKSANLFCMSKRQPLWNKKKYVFILLWKIFSF